MTKSQSIITKIFLKYYRFITKIGISFDIPILITKMYSRRHLFTINLLNIQCNTATTR